MSGPAEIVALGLLDAGWQSGGLEYALDGDHVVVLLRTPPIPIVDTPEFHRLLARALKEPTP